MPKLYEDRLHWIAIALVFSRHDVVQHHRWDTLTRIVLHWIALALCFACHDVVQQRRSEPPAAATCKRARRAPDAPSPPRATGRHPTNGPETPSAEYARAESVRGARRCSARWSFALHVRGSGPQGPQGESLRELPGHASFRCEGRRWATPARGEVAIDRRGAGGRPTLRAFPADGASRRSASSGLGSGMAPDESPLGARRFARGRASSGPRRAARFRARD
jgi:hypothetical protein